MGTSITGFQNAKISEAMKGRIVAAFEAAGYSQHSGRAETVWVLQKYCRDKGISFRIEVAKFEGRPVGVSILRTDKGLVMPAGKPPVDWVIEVAEEWGPDNDQANSFSGLMRTETLS